MTNLYCVIGDPIEHSLSPVIHMEFFKELKFDGQYNKVHIKRGHLAEGVEKLKRDGVKGFNITIPHKSDIIPLLDEIDPIAASIGAVNTVKNDNGKLIGYNTDAMGYIHSLKEHEPDFINKRIVIIGAGGAAKAIYFALASSGAKKVDISNRTLARCEEIILEGQYKQTHSHVLSLAELEQTVNDYDIFIQTTSVGMAPNINDAPISLKELKGKGKLASDIIYVPSETKFLQEAKQKGAQIVNGLDMLIYQAALAFEIWTGKMPTVDAARKTVLKQLEGVR